MSTKEITSDNFEETFEASEYLVLDFWAPWCGPCRSFAPTFEAVSEEHTDMVFGKVNTEEQPELAKLFGIRSIPTLAIFREQMPIFQQPGALPETVLEELLGRVRELDMEEVRETHARRVAEAEAQAAAEQG